MIEAGVYALRVRCDSPHVLPKLGESGEDQPRNLREAIRELRRCGWVFKRDGRTYCSRRCMKENAR